MQKSISLSLAVCLTLTGCSVFRRSGTWATVTSTRVNTRGEADPSKAYAEHLSRTLRTASVEHKVVTYQYRYRTRLREESIGTRTAVVYRDNNNPNNPWWLMDERLNKPVWLPGQDLNKQVAFYLRDDAEVVESRDIHGADENKSMLALAHRPKAQPMRELEATGIARLAPLQRHERSRQLFAHAPMKKPAAAPFLVARADEPRTWLRPARFAPVAPTVPAPAYVPAPPVNDSFDTMFRARHGTAFDVASVVDRRKMEHLQHAAQPHTL